VTVRVGVVDEHEIFRLGLVSCLNGAHGIAVVYDGVEAQVREDLDVAITSPEAERRHEFTCPVVVCSATPTEGRQTRNPVMAVLPRAGLTAEQLIATTHAAAAGLHVDVGERPVQQLSDRGREVLRLLATGADTREIAESLAFSERTIKTLVRELEQELGARSRAQAVAVGIRLGLI